MLKLSKNQSEDTHEFLLRLPLYFHNPLFYNAKVDAS